MGSYPWKFELQGWFGAPGRPSWRQDGPRCDLGRIWGSSWMPVGAHLGAKMGQVGAKMAPCWPTWRQDVPKKANLERTWRAFGSILLTFFASWARSFQNGRKPKKRRQFITFEGFFGSWGCSWRLCWLILALCWGMLAPSWSILAMRWGSRGQDEPRERPRAPR